MSSPIIVLLLLRRVDCNDGVASYCETLIKGLNARGDRVVLVSGPVTELYGSSTRREAISKGVLNWVVIDDLEANWSKLAVIRQLLAIMRAYSVGVISPQGLSLLPLSFLLSKLGDRPVVANYHPSMGGVAATSVATKRSFTTRLSYRVLTTLFAPERIIAISKDIVEFYRRDCGVSESRIAYIVNGVDTSFYRPPTQSERKDARSALGIPEDMIACVLSGRLNFVKGHDVIIDAMRIVRKKRAELRFACLFPGAGDQAGEIKAYAFKDDEDAATFRFLGFINDATALRTIYWGSDIAVLPSRFEGSPIFIAEAMNCGCVPIRTPSGGWQDQIVDGTTGFIIPFNDPQALADRILELSDQARRATMGENAARHAMKHLSQATMIAATSDLYRSSAKKIQPN